MRRYFTVTALLFILISSTVVHADVLGITTRETTLYKKAGSGWTDNRLVKGSVLELTGNIQDDWYPVRMRNGEEGWVASWLAWPMQSWTPIPPAFSEEDIPTTKYPLYGKIITGHAYFRNLAYGGLSGKYDSSRSGYIPKDSVLKITDRIKHWMKVQLTPTETGWIYDEAFIPTKKPAGNMSHGIPTATLKKLSVNKKKSGTGLHVKLSRSMPYSIVSNINPDLIRFKIYGVDCESLRWRWNAHCGKAGGWCGCVKETNVLEGYIPAPRGLAGYEAGYDDSVFQVFIKNPEKNPIKRIVIDPGHGAPEPRPPGYAEGAHGPDDCMEKDIVMSISKTLAGMLEKEGFEVFLTRDGESKEMMDLYKRIRFTESMKSDLFVSVHANGDVDPEIQGVEIYWYDIQNRRFAEILARELPSATGRKPGIAAFGSFAVIRQTRIPAVLVETGYLSHKEEGKLLCSAAFQKKTARGIADGISKYVNSLK